MNSFLILSSLLVLANAQYQNELGSYGAPAAPQYGPPQGYPQYGLPQGYPAGPQQQNEPQLPQEEEEDDRPLKLVKNVFVHVAPDDEASGKTRVIKAPIEKERQVNIIFVKAPAPAPAERQLVDIPTDGGKKTLVYVLLKKADATPDVDFKLPATTPATKPDVYFIRYKDQEKKLAAPAGPSAHQPAQYGAPVLPIAKKAGPAPSAGGYPNSPTPATLGGYQKK